YSELNIAAEPYFDIPLDEMLYLTDTGRRWDGSEVSVRDRTYTRDEIFYTEWERKPLNGSAMMMTEKGFALQKQFRVRTTDELIEAVRTHRFPDRIMLTLHPQRWSDNSIGWTIELVGQTVKNQLKYLYNRYEFGNQG
ncbi:MAG: hypothetical protein IH591_08925, partial [Bacteroidales bacterium]|nr:hypothetical protein [Bacteroidales bacterium]